MATLGTTYFSSTGQQSLVDILLAMKAVIVAQNNIYPSSILSTAIMGIDQAIITACEILN